MGGCDVLAASHKPGIPSTGSHRPLATLPGSGALLVFLRGKREQLLCASSVSNTGSELLPPRPKDVHPQLQKKQMSFLCHSGFTPEHLSLGEPNPGTD